MTTENQPTRRQLLRTGALAVGVAGTAPSLALGRHRVRQSGAERSYSTRTLDLVGESLVVDMLCPFTLAGSTSQAWYGNPANIPDSYFDDLKRSGIHVLHDAKGTLGIGAKTAVLTMAAAVNGIIAHHSHRLFRVAEAADLDRAQRGERVGVIFGIQNADHFETVDDVDLFFGLGQRISQLTYNDRNRIGTGATDRRDGGLSDFGVAIIERMNRLGMAVDVSHCGDRTSLEAFEASQKPVLVTHSTVRALAAGHVRCKPDEVIDAVGRAGSVFGVTGVRMFVKADEPTTIEHVLDHFDYVRDRIGPEHLGIGSDIDLYGYDAMPQTALAQLRGAYTKGKYNFRDRLDITGLDHPLRVFDLTEGLLARGWSKADVVGVLGGNFRRVLTEIWG